MRGHRHGLCTSHVAAVATPFSGFHQIRPPGTGPLIIAHRGAMGEAPENTLRAFEEAVAHGADAIEMDLHATRDGHLVVIHDATRDRTTDKRGRITDLTFTEIKEADAGFHFSPDGGLTFPYRGRGCEIPTLDDVLISFPSTPLLLEVKQVRPPIVEMILQALIRYRREDGIAIVSEYDDPLRQVRLRAPALPTGFSTREILDFASRVQSGNFGDWTPPGRLLSLPESLTGTPLATPDLITAAHARGLPVFFWTINDPDAMRRLLTLGADGIITDYPARLVPLIADLQ